MHCLHFVYLWPALSSGVIYAKSSQQGSDNVYFNVTGVVIKTYTVKDTLYAVTVNGYFQFKKSDGRACTLITSRILIVPLLWQIPHLQYRL